MNWVRYADIAAVYRSMVQSVLRTWEGKFQRDEAEDAAWTGGTAGSGTLVGTMRGIGVRTFARWRNCDPEAVTPEELHALTEHEAIEIAYNLFFLEAGLDRLPYSRVVQCLFDLSFTAGPMVAVQTLQRLVGVVEDGVLGPVTVGAYLAWINRMGVDEGLKALVERRLVLGEADVKRHPEKERTRTAWRHRLRSFLYDPPPRPIGAPADDAPPARRRGLLQRLLSRLKTPPP